MNRIYCVQPIKESFCSYFERFLGENIPLRSTNHDIESFLVDTIPLRNAGSLMKAGSLKEKHSGLLSVELPRLSKL
jgi:hypothetical protein